MTVSYVAAALAVNAEEGSFAALASILDLGISGALLAVIIWFLRWYTRQVGSGEWVPKRELDYLREDRDIRLAQTAAQCADWRAAHETSERTRELQAAQVAQLVEALRAQERFFDAFRAIIERADRDGADGVV